MFGWCIDLFRRWLFNRGRLIFRYWDGRRSRIGDPMILYRNLLAHEDFRSEDLALIQVKDLFPKMVEKLSRVYRDVFSVKQAVDGGLTDVEAVQNLTQFIAFAGLQKKSTEPTPTSPPSTDMPVSQDSQPETNISADSDSTSTSTEPPSGKQ